MHRLEDRHDTEGGPRRENREPGHGHNGQNDQRPAHADALDHLRGHKNLDEERGDLSEGVELGEARYPLAERVRVVQDDVGLREVDQRIRDRHQHDIGTDAQQVR